MRNAEGTLSSSDARARTNAPAQAAEERTFKTAFQTNMVSLAAIQRKGGFGIILGRKAQCG